ncbi:methyltransferase domain-containing protein [Candidatus Woesearchaeota archaeon]|nr:methyltransferase domain-containing protein [Candidatus Woesearchaeota archaeon]
MYNYICSSYDALHGKEQLAKLAIVRELLDVGKDDRILDVGCGTGLSHVLGCSVVGIDSSPGMIGVGQKRIDARIGYAESLPFDAKSFDHVICITAIHNFSDHEKAIDELARVARKKIVVSILRKSSMFRAINESILNKLVVEKVVRDDNDDILLCRPGG